MAIGSPVPVTALIARTLFACGEGPEWTAKGEVGGGTQPGIPGGCSHRQPGVLPIAQIDQRFTLHDRSRVVIVPHAHPQMFPGQRFQNSIAHVREPSLHAETWCCSSGN